MEEFNAFALCHGEKELSQVEVCDFCGDRGFTNALINCSDCCKTLVHQYCLGIAPGSIDDSFNWLCEYCCTQLEREPCSSTKSVDTSSKEKGKKKKKKRKRETGPPILQSEKPVTLGSKCKRIRKEQTEDQSLLTTNKVATHKFQNSKNDLNVDSVVDHKTDCGSSSMGNSDDGVHETPNNYAESAIIPVEDQPEPLLALLPIKLCGYLEHPDKAKHESPLLDCWEETEVEVSSVMENPEELTRGIILLVSPSGEVFIHEDPGLSDKYSGMTCMEVTQYESKADLRPTVGIHGGYSSTSKPIWRSFHR